LQIYASIDDIRMPLSAVAGHAQRAERLGCDGLVVPEAVYDAIPAATLALAATTRLRVATGVVVAFARSPMLLAQDAWALAQLSGGRFELGLGPQVKGNVEKRFGMPWSAPAARMHDYVTALRAVFTSWQQGTPLRHQGPSYTLTRMQPFFVPEKLSCAQPELLLGAIGPKMIGVAGEVGDGLIAHPTNSTPRYLREVVRPGLAEGARKAGRAAGAVRLIANPMTATGPDAASVAAEREAARDVLAFTYSTPAYWATLDHHGWGDVGRTLLERTREGAWDGLRDLISDAMLDALVPTAPFGEIAALLEERYVGVADALTMRLPKDPAHDDDFARVIATLRES
jgi:probable F420-dependent oxidoreductase